MPISKFSKQRQALINELCSRVDHPTAETLYLCLKKEFPNLSLGTVYRNLNMLSADNKIMKISIEGADRYDGNPAPHCHFMCNRCLRMFDIEGINSEAPFKDSLIANVNGKIESYSLNLYGICNDCMNNE